MFGEKQQEIDTLRQQLEQATGQLALAQAAEGLAQTIRSQLQEYVDSGQTLTAARNMAEAAVLATEQQRAVEDLKTQLIEEHGADIAATYRREHGPAIKRELHARLQQDGTYDKVAATAHESVEAEIRQELLDEEKARIEAELSDPAAKAAFMETSRARLRGSQELAAYRDKVRKGLETGWTAEAQQQAQQEIDAEEAAREDEFKRQVRERYFESSQGRSYRQNLTERLKRTWHDKTVEDVQAELSDALLAELLAERAAQEAEKLRRENKSNELLRDFERAGVKLDSIEEGSIVTLYMGTLEEGGNTYNPNHNDYRKSVILQCDRRLTLVARGDGKLKVRADSLSTSKSSWERSLAIEEGSIVVLGNVVRENHSSKLEPCIAADVNLYYDTDPATPETFSEMPVPVVNIEIDNIAARKIDEVKGPGAKQPKRN